MDDFFRVPVDDIFFFRDPVEFAGLTLWRDVALTSSFSNCFNGPPRFFHFLQQGEEVLPEFGGGDFGCHLNSRGKRIGLCLMTIEDSAYSAIR
jgi:hypothetical protein